MTEPQFDKDAAGQFPTNELNDKIKLIEPSGIVRAGYLLMTAAGAIIVSNGVSSVVKGGAGQYTINFIRSSPLRVIEVTAQSNAVGDITEQILSSGPSSAAIQTQAGGVLTDLICHITFYEPT